VVIPTRVSEKIPEPKNLLELINFALDENHIYGTNVLCEVVEQLYNTDATNVMVLVDEYNEFFKQSSYESFKYVNMRDADGTIAPWDLSLARLFMRFDGHRIRNGVKIMATSEYRHKFRTFSPEKINLEKRHVYEVERLEVDDFRSLIRYYMDTSWMEKISEGEILSSYMVS